ncbi:MAG TPA: ATP-binding protein [Longimicrobiales bacterium]|nr:ATP-binding protein [Longimicrobiales bacterium]
MRRRIPWVVLFLAAALLALAFLPIYVDRRVADDEVYISTVLEPAQDRIQDLTTIYARQESRLQEFLVTGSSLPREQLNALRGQENEILEELNVLVVRPELERVRLALAPVMEAATRWQIGHSSALDTPEGRAEYIADLDTGLDNYERVLATIGELRRALDLEIQFAEDRLAEERVIQRRVTLLLVALALIALALVALLSRHLSDAVSETTKRREDEVQARREIDAVLEATAEAVLGLDLDRMVIRLNQAGTRLLGFSEEDARGRSFQDVLHAGLPDPASRMERPEAEAIREAMEQGSAVAGVDGEVHPRRGGAVEVRWSLRPLVDGRKVRGAVLTLTDMREVRSAERALRKAVQAREETLAVVGHDLRSPLGSISAGAELLLDVPLSEDKRRRQLTLIQSAAQRMNRLIQDLMDVARMDSGGFQVMTRRGELGRALDAALSIAENRADRCEVELIRAWPASLPPVWLDEDRIVQVVDNLLSNALRYTPPGGSVEVGAAARDDGVEVWVRDTGAGIAEEDLAHLWDPFWRPESSDQEGSGLGLAIVKGIVEAHGGGVAVESRPGRGSRFSFTLRRVD